MGDYASLSVRSGWARAITKSEFVKLLRQADEHNLVLETSNSKEAAFICCCCGCCCGVLQGLKKLPKPGRYSGSPYVVRFDTELCNNCELCLDRCQMEALSAGETHINWNSDRCIGCGLCVTTCPTEALSLAVRTNRSDVELNERLQDTWKQISKLEAETPSR